MKKYLYFLSTLLSMCYGSTIYSQTNNFGIGTTTPGSKLTVNGSFAGNYRIATATDNIAADDYYVAYNGASNGTLTLPAAISGTGNFLGRIYHFKNTGSTTLTVAANGSELIDNHSGSGISSISLNPGYYVMLISKGTTSGTTWEVALIAATNPTIAYEAIGTTSQTIAAGNTSDLPGATITVTTTLASTTLLITYSAIALPVAANAPIQGTINLVVDGVKQVSSYYSASDAPATLTRLGNYSTSQKIITVAAGTHTIKLQAKSWFNTSVFNVDPVAAGYSGAIASDASAMKARLSVLVVN